MEYISSVEKHTGYQITKLNILADEDVKILRSDNGGEYTSTVLLDTVLSKESHTSSLFPTVHNKMELLNA